MCNQTICTNWSTTVLPQWFFPNRGFMFRLFLHLNISRIRLSNSHLPTTTTTHYSPPPSALYSSISSIRSSPSREASIVTWTALTVPATGELTTVSIFIAERTHSGWPFSTFYDDKDSSRSIKKQGKHTERWCWRLTRKMYSERRTWRLDFWIYKQGLTIVTTFTMNVNFNLKGQFAQITNVSCLQVQLLLVCWQEVKVITECQVRFIFFFTYYQTVSSLF